MLGVGGSAVSALFRLGLRYLRLTLWYGLVKGKEIV